MLSSHRGWGSAPLGVAVAGSCAYLARGSAGLQVLDIADPTKPAWLTGTSWGSTALDVALAGSRILVAAGNGGLLVYELQRSLQPPLKPPVIEGGMMTFTWPALDGVRLQKATHLNPANWEDVPESEGTNLVILPSTEPMAFFRPRPSRCSTS